MKPQTDKVFRLKTKRLDFNRRKSHKDKLLMIVHFEGVVGMVNKKFFSDDVLRLELRHGAVEALKDLMTKFQVVLFTFLNEKTIELALEFLAKE